MPRQLVFVGNCQVEHLGLLFRRVISPTTGDRASCVPSYRDATSEDLQRIAEADIVVQQVHNWLPAIGEISTKARIVFVPHATGAFLWPYGGEAHPCDSKLAAGELSPYPNELGDAFLNRLIRQNVAPEEALRAYLAADVAKRAERLFELHLEQQRERDRLSGFKLAPLLEQEFRRRQLFVSPNHPTIALFAELVRHVFETLSLTGTQIEAVIAQSAKMKPSEAPIHPMVARHFDLAYVGPGRRYRYMREGSFTFDEYVLRYMRYEYNDDLRRGLRLMRQGQHDAAAAILMPALERSPRSVSGRRALRAILIRLGRPDEALAVARELAALEPENASHRQLAETLSIEIGNAASRPPQARAIAPTQ